MKWNGNKIKKLIKDRGKNVSTFADSIGVSRPTVYSWITGQIPKGDHLLKICRDLNTNPDSFFSSENAPVTVPVHRQRRTSKITLETQNEAYNLTEAYINLFRNSATPEIVAVSRDSVKNQEKASAIAINLRARVKIPPDKPMDFHHTFKLIDELGINIIFKDFPSAIKSYAFYTKIINHRVIFLNNSTKLPDLVFPLLHESIHAIRDEIYVAESYDNQEEEFCDLVANFIQFPTSYVKLVYETINDLDKRIQINKLKNFARQNVHSLFGIIKAIKIIYPNFDLNVGAADSNLRKEFKTIGDYVYGQKDILKFLETLKALNNNFFSVVSNQIKFLSDRNLTQILNLGSVHDAKLARIELMSSLAV